MKANHEQEIYDYCKKNGSITVHEANLLDINSPRKVISVMRKSGRYNIKTIEETKTNKHGNKVRYNRYFITEVGV